MKKGSYLTHKNKVNHGFYKNGTKIQYEREKSQFGDSEFVLRPSTIATQDNIMCGVIQQEQLCAASMKMGV